MSRQTVLITGCTPGGIGHGMALEYHAKGLRVIASARRVGVLDDLKNMGIDVIQLDVTDLESIKRAREQVNQLTGGKLDILVNNAGKSYTVPATDVTYDEIKSLFDTNVFGVMLMCQEFVHLLIAAKGKIVNIGSVAGILPVAFGSVYNASKAAIHAYGNTLRVELKPFGVQVITIITGGVKSNISTHNKDILPHSIFSVMSDEFNAKRKGASQKGATPTDVFSRDVVRQTLKARPSVWIWSGKFSFTTWFVNIVLPQRAIDAIVSRKFGLDTLTKRLAAKQRSR